VDDTGKHPAIFKGGVTVGLPGAIAGDPDTAVGFDGVSGFIELDAVTDFEFAPGMPFTIEAWVKRTGPGFTIVGKAMLVDAAAPAPLYAGYLLGYNGAETKIELFRENTSLFVDRKPDDTTRFVHTVGTFDGVNIAIYLDGDSAGAKAASALDAGPTGVPLELGKTLNWGSFTGVLDEVAIYDKALAPARIKRHHEVGTTPQ
jgi:hypothetical protein